MRKASERAAWCRYGASSFRMLFGRGRSAPLSIEEKRAIGNQSPHDLCHRKRIAPPPGGAAAIAAHAYRDSGSRNRGKVNKPEWWPSLKTML